MTAREIRPLIAANWKMHFGRTDVQDWVRGFFGAATSVPWSGADLVVFPSFPLLDTARGALIGSGVEVGGQDLHSQAQGAFTGDVSAAQLLDAGCAWALVGHSERRRDHGESDLTVGRKLAAAAAAGLKPLVCVGESREDRLAGSTPSVLEAQLRGILEGCGATIPSFDLAYEPVWAIGTGETATPALAQEAHVLLRSLLAQFAGSALASATRIVYGGSATPDNAASLFVGDDIDGFLVGGASLDPVKFLGIVRVCSPEPGARAS